MYFVSGLEENAYKTGKNIDAMIVIIDRLLRLRFLKIKKMPIGTKIIKTGIRDQPVSSTIFFKD